MRDPGLAELELALARFCDEVLGDFTFPTREGDVRRVHWRYRGREFRATVLLAPGGGVMSLDQLAVWRRRGARFDLLPSRPIFESQNGPFSWQTAMNLGIWRWALTTAGRRDPGDDETLPGDLAGRPVRPRPGLPSLSASAAAIPEPPEYESRRYGIATLPRGGAEDERGLLIG